MADIQAFKNCLIEADIVDPEGIHHEFVSGIHGQKIDFDKIPTEGSLFQEWCIAIGDRVRERYPLKHFPAGIVLLSIAGGTNRLVEPVAETLGPGYTPALTEKVAPKEVALTRGAVKIIDEMDPELIIALEDVGTSGTTSATAVSSARQTLKRRDTQVTVLNTWQRSETLPKLHEIKVDYDSIIYEPMISYTPEQCKSVGFCAAGWAFISRD